MKKLYEKNEVRFAVIMIVIYVIGTSLGEFISEVTGTFKIASAIFHVAFGIFLFAWIKRNGLMEKYGLVKPAYKLYKAWFFIPLFLIGCSSLFFGLRFNYSAFGTVCYLLSMFGVGFLEEILFRGFLFEGMAKNNVKAAIIVSSITFGVGHIVNLLNGQDLFETLLQIVFAVAVGFVLVTLYYKGGSIIPCMIFHAVNNSCSAFNKPEVSAQFFGGAKNEMIITVVAAIVISVVYSIAMWLKLEKNEVICYNGFMELKLKKVPAEEPEVLEIRCHKVTDNIQEIISFVKSRQGQLCAYVEGQSIEVPVIDVFYAESVDNRLFIYTAKESYELRIKLYELEEMLKGKSFIRVQKGMLLNLLKVKSIKPALSGRYTALLKNGEEIVISRKYVPDFKDTLKGRR